MPAYFAVYGAAVGWDLTRVMTYTTDIGTRYLPGGLVHTWSLSVEEQFYVAWPLLLLGAFRIGGRRLVALVALGVALAVGLVRQSVDLGYGAAFYLLRWDALLLGCAIACYRPRMSPLWVIPAAGVLCYYSLTRRQEVMSAFVVIELACVALVACADRIRLLESAVLRYFGTISYSLYLWHWPIFCLDIAPWQALGLSWCVADLSYRLVERTFRASDRAASPRSPAALPGDPSGVPVGS